MDELNVPLGQRQPPKRRIRSARLVIPVLAALSGVAVTALVLLPAMLREQPVNVSVAERAMPALPDAPLTTQSIGKAEPAPDTPPSRTVTIIDGLSGKRQEVIIGAAPESRRTISDPKLLESTPHGMIPRIAEDGRRPSTAYARKLAAAGAEPAGPQIAIIVGGLGSSANMAAAVMSKLPGTISLAFTPYASDLDAIAAQARGKGHELLLQVPMEPQEADNEPGPNTLLTSLPAEQNIDRLHWTLSRMQGYVGVTNFMGARFMASESAMTPVVRELSKRGLIYVDDGMSTRSQAGTIARAAKAPYAKADVVLDAIPSAAEIDDALKRLETAARGNGVAIGYASALPATIDRIARWVKAAQARGIVLIPITAAVLRERST